MSNNAYILTGTLTGTDTVRLNTNAASAKTKEILNSIGVAQAVTDKDRANISLSYHCVSLTDVYWVREQGKLISFQNINLYDNPLNEAVVELSLKGRQMTVTNQELAPDLSTKGCFPKAWIRGKNGFKLLKDGGRDTVRKELLASKICQCFRIPQVKYHESFYQGQLVSESDIITSKERSMVSLTQREAAVEAVKKIGLPQIKEMDISAFEDMKDEAEMFICRLNELKKARE